MRRRIRRDFRIFTEFRWVCSEADRGPGSIMPAMPETRKATYTNAKNQL